MVLGGRQWRPILTVTAGEAFARGREVPIFSTALPAQGLTLFVTVRTKTSLGAVRHWIKKAVAELSHTT